MFCIHFSENLNKNFLKKKKKSIEDDWETQKFYKGDKKEKKKQMT